jgi:cholesterol oxidase
MVDDAGERATDMPAAAHDYDVLVIGSGFGGSVTALRLTEKGYRVGVLEAGRRFEDADYATTSWEARKFPWAPKLGCKGIQRIHLLRDVIILAGAGVGGGSLVYANTLYRPGDAFYSDRQWAHVTDWRAELAPYYDQAERMLGVVRNPTMTPSDEVLKRVAEEMGVGDTFGVAPVGVFFGREGRKEPGVAADDPVLRRRGSCTPRLRRVRGVHDRMPAGREEHARQELPVPRRKGRRGGAPGDHGHRGAAAGVRRVRG